MSNSRLAVVATSLSLLCLISSVALGAGHAAKAAFVVGDVRAIDATGAARALGRGDFVFSGDTVATQKDGRAQLKFADGGMASLRANTEYRIDDYHYEGKADGGERSFFNLIKGSVRFVTGVVGHANKKNFRIKTKVATIGIRGSGGRVTSCVGGSCAGQADGTYLTTYAGILTLTSGPFSVDVNVDESYHCSEVGGCSKIEATEAQRIGTPMPQLDETYRQGDQEHGSDHGPAQPGPSQPEPSYPGSSVR